MTLLHRNPNRRAARARLAALRAEPAPAEVHFAGEIVDVRHGDTVETVRIIALWTEQVSLTPMLTVIAHPHGLLSHTVRADAVVTEEVPRGA